MQNVISYGHLPQMEIALYTSQLPLGHLHFHLDIRVAHKLCQHCSNPKACSHRIIWSFLWQMDLRYRELIPYYPQVFACLLQSCQVIHCQLYIDQTAYLCLQSHSSAITSKSNFWWVHITKKLPLVHDLRMLYPNWVHLLFLSVRYLSCNL